MLLTMVMSSRNGSSGFRLLGGGRTRGPLAGAHRFFLIPNCVLPADPCTISIAIRRTFLRRLRPVPCAYAREAGSIASRNGSASVTPMPLSIVRRGRDLLVRSI